MTDGAPGEQDPTDVPEAPPERPGVSGFGAHRRHMSDALHLVTESGMDVDQEETPDYEETEHELQMGIVKKVLRAVGGFMLIGLGVALLPLPGPGWVIILLGLALLPFAWAERTILRIRRTIPGIPEDGKIPLHTWIIMGAIVVAMALLAWAFGDNVGDWIIDTWSNLRE